jgi:hypothetical protein
MVLLTFIVGTITIRARFASVKRGDVKARYYKLMAGQNVPDKIIQTTRNFNNQFEVPLLFYVVGTLYIAMGIESTFALYCAWLFVVFRVIHAYIHLSYNYVLHRLLAFWIALCCVLALWVNLVIVMPAP